MQRFDNCTAQYLKIELKMTFVSMRRACSLSGTFPRRFLLLLLLQCSLLFSSLHLASGAYCNGSPVKGNFSNENPISDANLKIIKVVKNGILMEAGPENGRFPIIHLYGDSYSKGFAQGTLLKDYLTKFVDKTFKYLTNMAVEEMGDLFPKVIQEKIVSRGIKAALNWCAEVTKPFTSQSYYDEIQGIADASGLDFDLILQLNMLPEITKASCSFIGAWGSAAENGKTYQLRALDYDTDGPFKEFPLVSIYHPDSSVSDTTAFASVGFPATLGVLTGFSAEKLGISEIGVSYPDDSFGQGTDNTPPEKVHGIPWMFLLRDVLTTSKSAEEAILAIQNANRTCNLIIGVGDGKSKTVTGIQYSGYVAQPYRDFNMLPVNATWHPVVANTSYNAMDWLCPNYDSVMAQQLAQYSSTSSISPASIIRHILPTVQTGSLHVAVYDLEESYMYLSFMNSTGPEFAYQKQFTVLPMKDLFATEEIAV